jgi:tRNA-modifying protein YgfZ
VIQADKATADVVRIENGKPRYGVDITDASLPQETQQMYAVHPTKGCYIGQEIVERVRSRGHVNKLLVALDIEASEAPKAGAKVEADGKEVGTITSAAYSPARGKVAAIGIVRNEAMNSPLTVSGSSATVRPTAK